MRPVITLSLALFAAPALAQESFFPDETWWQYAEPEQAGFSPEALEEVRSIWESSQSAGYMIVYRGAVVASWGDLERRFMCHSTRKSLLSGLIGVEVEAGRLDLEQTMAELGITDTGSDGEGLTETELTATVHDLIKARSGVFRLAAYEPPQNPKPERGAHAPGEFWCYNNWDFNTLVTIYEQESGKGVFGAFEEHFAKPLGMQDYRPRDGYYHYEREKSAHPAYPFRLSGRDMARYGLLYLNDGMWNGERVLSEEWVDASHAAHSSEGVWGGGGYGYMWWLSGEPELEELGAYSARGVGGQLIQVIPGAELVLVNRTDTFQGHRVDDELWELAKAVVAANTGEAQPEPELTRMESKPRPVVTLSDAVRERIVRTWPEAMGFGEIEIRMEGEDLVAVLADPAGMSFDLWPVSETAFRVEGFEAGVLLELHPDDPTQDVLISEAELNGTGYEHLQAGRTEEAVAVFERVAALFPDSWNAWDSLGEGHMTAGNETTALECYRRSVELNPRNTAGREHVARLEAELDDVPVEAGSGR